MTPPKPTSVWGIPAPGPATANFASSLLMDNLMNVYYYLTTPRNALFSLTGAPIVPFKLFQIPS